MYKNKYYSIFLVFCFFGCNDDTSGISASSLSAAFEQIQSLVYDQTGSTPLATEDPSTVLYQGSNLMDPQNTFTIPPSRVRSPVRYEQNLSAYPTSSWGMDLAYLAKGTTIDTFTVAQFPYGVSPIDDTTIPGSSGEWPGLSVQNPRSFVLKVLPFPSTSGLSADIPIATLGSDFLKDYSVKMPLSVDPKKVTRTITHYDDLVFNTKWTDTDSSGSLEALIARGSPYMTFQYDNLGIRITSNQTYSAFSVDDQPKVAFTFPLNQSFSGKKFRVVIVNSYPAPQVTNAYCEYVLYFSSQVDLVFTRSSGSFALESRTPYTGILRVAYVGHQIATGVTSNQGATEVALSQRENILDRYANVYPIKSSVELLAEHSSPKALVKFNWETRNFDPSNPNQDLLMTAFNAAQIPSMMNPQLEPNLTYATLKGQMTGIVGNGWVQELSLPTTSWNASTPISSSYVTQLKEYLAEDTNSYRDLLQSQPQGDLLLAGKNFAKVARLILIGDQLGDITGRTLLTNVLKTALSAWFPALGTQPSGGSGFFKYDQKYGGVVTARALSSTAIYDNSNAYYREHSARYGYFIYAAAVLGKFDPAWLSAYKDKINILARDIANPSDDDAYFTRFRHFDWFEGHSYSSGIEPSALGRDQESISEAVNAWYALSLWGEVTGNKNMRDLARILTALEIRSAQAWWQYQPGQGIFDAYAAPANSLVNTTSQTVNVADFGMGGLHYSTKVDFSTSLGSKLGYMLGIQILPVTPITEELLTSTWVGSAQPIINKALGNFNTMLDLYSNKQTAFSTFTGDTFLNCAGGNNTTPPSLSSSCGFTFSLIVNNAYKWGIVTEMIDAIASPSRAYSQIFQVLPDKVQLIADEFGSSSFVTNPPLSTNFVNKAAFEDTLTKTNILWWIATRPAR